MKRPFLRYQSPREKLEIMRAEYKAAEKFIRMDAQHRRHEKKHPGRMDELMQEADRYLQQAEWLLPALAEGNPAQKIGLVGFDATLRLAYRFMLRANIDPAVVYGLEQFGFRGKGGAATKALRASVTTPLIATLAREKDELGYAQPSELWPKLYSQLEELQLCPKEKGNGTDKRYDYDGGCITYEAFRQTLYRKRS